MATTKRNFYAWQNEATGITLWRFATKRERDEWVNELHWRKPLPGRDVDGMLRMKGAFVRWAKPQFVRPQ